MSSVPGVEVRRLLSASPEEVFAAFADPTLVAQWLRPSPDVTLTVLAFDFSRGGAYRFAYDEATDRRMVVGGTFRAIEAPARIVLTWVIEPPDEHAGIDSEVTVQLVPRGSSTELTIRHARLGREDARMRHEQGWRGALDLLEASVGGSRGARAIGKAQAKQDRAALADAGSVREVEEPGMMRRIGVGALAYLVPTFALGFVWHLVAFKSHYDALAMYRRDVIIPFGFLAMTLQAVLFAWVFDGTFFREQVSLPRRALSFAVFGAVLSWSFTTLAVAAKNVMSSVPHYVVIETLFTIVQWSLVGPLMALALARAQRRVERPPAEA